MDHLLTLLIVVPLAGLIPLVAFFRDTRAVKQVAVVTTFIELVLSLVMLAQFHAGEAGFQLTESAAWLPTFGIRYELGVDGISVLLVPMTTLLTFVAVLYSTGGAIKQRLGEFNALLEVVQEEAEGMFIATASTVRGVRTGAAALHTEDEDAPSATGPTPEEHDDGYIDPDQPEAGATRPRVRPRRRDWA